MSFLAVLESIFIGPLKLLFEIIFKVSMNLAGHPGIAIIFLSLIMNILVLPLYRRADSMQEEARITEEKLGKYISHIKKSFSGDERMMILQAYYRQNNYKPTDALNGSVSLLLEIPFFMAAYQFLSNLDILSGVSFGPIKNLAESDGLLLVGNLSINLLPILMTAVNVVSSAIYLKGFPLKTKIQLYGMAAFFLVFLYDSPSALVFYWTLNNVFSLIKTIFYKIKNPKKILSILLLIMGVFFVVFSLFFYKTPSEENRLIVTLIGLALMVPIFIDLVRKNFDFNRKKINIKHNKTVFVLGCIFMALLVGVLIPSNYISSSPQEFVDVTYYHNPLYYVLNTACVALGAFVVWFGVFYWIANDNWKGIFDKLIWILCGASFLNYMFFGTKLGIISSNLQYENGLAFSYAEHIVNIIILVTVSLVLYFIAKKRERLVSGILVTSIVTTLGMSVFNIVKINASINEINHSYTSDNGEVPNIVLSDSGKNVIVIMLDRAMGEYVPYLFAEKPELKEQFRGFTYYENTVSFGGFTNFGAPPLLGGYEYTPVEINKRGNESLVSKHNEALKVMPVLFMQNGYKVNVFDPVYANYQWIPDISIFDEYKNINAYITKGRFTDISRKEAVIKNNHRNFFCFGLMKSFPTLLQAFLYDNGQYNRVKAYTDTSDDIYTTQKITGISTAEGLFGSFMESYNVLTSMPYMTKVQKSEENTFLFMSSDITHEPVLLQTPDYTPSSKVDNTVFDSQNKDRFILNDRELKVETPLQMSHYQTNMTTFIQIGNWLDDLRSKGVYDNTRIILVSDHGRYLKHFDDMILDDGSDLMYNTEMYYPLLMVKDFNSKTFTTSDEFMTNADVPTIATKGLIENPINPFTGKVINDNEKYTHDQYIIMSPLFNVSTNNGNVYKASQWASVSKDMRVRENWKFNKKTTVLVNHSFD